MLVSFTYNDMVIFTKYDKIQLFPWLFILSRSLSLVWLLCLFDDTKLVTRRSQYVLSAILFLAILCSNPSFISNISTIVGLQRRVSFYQYLETRSGCVYTDIEACIKQTIQTICWQTNTVDTLFMVICR